MSTVHIWQSFRVHVAVDRDRGFATQVTSASLCPVHSERMAGWKEDHRVYLKDIPLPEQQESRPWLDGEETSELVALDCEVGLPCVESRRKRLPSDCPLRSLGPPFGLLCKLPITLERTLFFTDGRLWVVVWMCGDGSCTGPSGVAVEAQPPSARKEIPCICLGPPAPLGGSEDLSDSFSTTEDSTGWRPRTSSWDLKVGVASPECFAW